MAAALMRAAVVLLFAFFLTGVRSSSCSDSNFEKHQGRDGSASPVALHVTDNWIMMDNGIVRVVWSNPEGYVVQIQYGGIDNVLEYHNKIGGRGALIGSSFRVIKQDDDHTEISFTMAQNELTVDLRYVMLRGVSGYYSYAVIKHGENSGPIDMGQLRAAYKLRLDKFHYMAVSDNIQRIMPSNCDRTAGHSSPLAYKEAVLITDPCDNEMQSIKGEVDDKYLYTIENKDNKVHGWISTDPAVGFWIITPSSEFRTGGPFKQNLASHTGPTCLAPLYTDHYVGTDASLRIDQGESWKMVYGPFLVHLNSVSDGENPHKLWDMAKDQVLKEEQKWPYDFPQSEDYVKPCERGSVRGQLMVYDRLNNNTIPQPGSSAWIGLAPPGDKGSWQLNTKGYQFWTQADKNGRFEIKGVIPDIYNLFASVPGVIGSELNLDHIVYEPPRNGPTLWEIGVPDRTAAEFFIPDPDPTMVNRLFLNDTDNKFRQYGLWLQYAKLYPPNQDLVYNVGTSDYKKDWFYSHVTRVIGKDDSGKNVYGGTTRQITFQLDRVIPYSVYTLQIAIASSNYAELQVRVNNPFRLRPNFRTGMFGKDNAIARHGIHGIYKLFTVSIPSSSLYQGRNTIYLTQPRHSGAFAGLLYDYIRLEGPSWE
ncbi:hypothetical protein V2J09_009561 [Rumex salicifolius]